MSRSISQLPGFILVLTIMGTVGVGRASAQATHDHETRAVYTAVLDELYKSRETPGVILLSDSVMRYGGDRSWVSTPVAIDYEAPPMKDAFPADFAYRVPIRLLARDEKESLHKKGQRIADSLTAVRGLMAAIPFWLALAQRYPSAWGITTFGEVVFNAARNKALVWVAHSCGGCFHEETMLLEKIGARWRVQDRLVKADGSQDGIGPGNMRHLWVDARLRVDSMIADHLRLMREADSMRLDTRPRRWRGVLVNKATRLPSSQASVFLSTALDTVPRLLEFVRKGEFELIDHPIGGALLLIQCPGSRASHTEPLAVVNVQIEPAQDTTVVIELGSRRPCWTESRIRPLVSGTLQSREFTSSPFPSRAETGVIAALYREVFPGPRKPLLRAFTGVKCEWWAECSLDQLAVHVREGALDSATIRDFLKQRPDSVPVNSRFAATIDITLLTPDNERFLAAEGATRESRSAWPRSHFGLMEAVREAYPSSDGIITINRPGFNSDSTQALVEVHHDVTFDSTRAEIILFTRDGDRWRLARRHLSTDITSGELVEGRCVPARAGTPPTEAELAGLEGEYLFNLISNAGGGEYVQWRARYVRPPDGSLRPSQLSRGQVVNGPGPSASRYEIKVRRVGEETLFGGWVAHFTPDGVLRTDGRGNVVPDPAGHFCATRIR